MTDKTLSESQEWAVTGMDCAACAVKIRTAVERLPGVSDVSVAVMAEKLTLRLEPGTTPRDKIEAAVVKLGFGIGATKAAKAKAFVLPGAKVEKPAHDHQHDHQHDDHGDHAGHDHLLATSGVTAADQSHGAPGHLHDDPADKGKAWFQTGKGRLVIGTGMLLVAAWAVKLLASADIANWAFIAACVIGGASLMGGRGTIFGACLGALIMASLDNGMSLLNVRDFMQDIIKGAILVAAVGLDMMGRKQS